jgi:hypothetical protein
MSDNLGYTPGAGATVATDEVDGRHFQAIKIAHGADGEAAYASQDNPLPTRDEELAFLIARVINALNAPQGYDKSQQRQRATVIIESGTVTTVGTVSAVTNVAAIGGDQAQILTKGSNLSAWRDCVRSLIS